MKEKTPVELQSEQHQSSVLAYEEGGANNISNTEESDDKTLYIYESG